MAARRTSPASGRLGSPATSRSATGRAYSWYGWTIDSAFRARPLRAFKRGKENRQAEAATYDANRANLAGPPRSVRRPHVIARATLSVTRCTTPSPRSLPCSSIPNCSTKACLKSNGTMRAACKTSCSWESVKSNRRHAVGGGEKLLLGGLRTLSCFAGGLALRFARRPSCRHNSLAPRGRAPTSCRPRNRADTANASPFQA